jgi:hypothetical protein
MKSKWGTVCWIKEIFFLVDMLSNRSNKIKITIQRMGDGY